MNALSLFSDGVNPRKVNLILEHLGPGGCLDLGCGAGLYGDALERTCGELLQIDIKDRRAVSANKYPFLECDLTDFELLPTGYKHAVAYDIIEHLDDDEGFLKAIRGICSGKLILSVPSEEDDSLRRCGVTHKHHIDKTHRREYTRERLEALLHEVGYKKVIIIPQYNRSLVAMPMLLAKPGKASFLVGKVLTYQLRLMRWAGLLEDRVVSDWFCVAE